MERFRRIFSQFLRALNGGLGLAILAMIVTGGAKFKLKQATLEASQVDVWIAIAGILTALEFKINSGRVPMLAQWILKIRDGLLSFATAGKFPRLSSHRIIIVILLFLTFLFSLIHIERHLSFFTNIMDMGVIHHVIANTLNGRFMACDTCPNGTYLSDHLAFILPWVSPLLWLVNRPEIIFIFQSALIALTLYLLLVWGPLGKNPLRWVFAVFIILCHPALRNAWIWDFREDHLAFFFLSLCALAVWNRNLLALTFFTFCSLLCKENIAFLFPLFFGFYFYLGPHPKEKPLAEPRVTLSLVILTLSAIVWAYFSLQILLPHFSGSASAPHQMMSRIEGMGNSSKDLLQKFFSKPFYFIELIFKGMFSRNGIHYLISLLGPWIFLSYRNWPWLFVAIPGILMNLISSAGTQLSMLFHYELIIFPFLIMALLKGVSKASPRQMAWGLFIALLFSGRWPGLHVREFWPTRSDLTHRDWISTLPQDSILAANDQLFAQVAHRPGLRLLTFPSGFQNTSSADLALQLFNNHSRSDFTEIPGHGVHEAKYFLLDLKRPNEAKLFKILKGKGNFFELSPDGRLGWVTPVIKE